MSVCKFIGICMVLSPPFLIPMLTGATFTEMLFIAACVLGAVVWVAVALVLMCK